MGWTMGNIAATATDVSRFYWALANGKLISNTSLNAMLDFKNFTDCNPSPSQPPCRPATLPGAVSNSPYGMGLFSMMLRFPLAGVQSCTAGSTHRSSSSSSSSSSGHMDRDGRGRTDDNNASNSASG